MEFKCPECGRFVFNRRLANCEFCNAELPPELLYTKEEQEQADRQVKEDIKKQFEQHRKEREGQNTEDDAADKDAGSAISRVMKKVAAGL